MDMTENDNRLLEQFFQEAAVQQIEDNGFTERVMERIQEQTEGATSRSILRSSLLSHLWTLFCVVLFVVAFIIMQGWHSLLQTVQVILTYTEVLLRTLPTAFDPSELFQFPPSDTTMMLIQVLLVVGVLMTLSVVGVSRWAIRREL